MVIPLIGTVSFFDILTFKQYENNKISKTQPMAGTINEACHEC